MSAAKQDSNNAMIELAEKASQNDAVSAMTEQMQASLSSIGSVDNLRHTIMTYVAQEKYDRATEELNAYLDSKPDYPMFRERAGRYLTYCVELIQAIRAKRSFPGWSALNMSKQKDLFERALEHFEELKRTLTKIEVIEKEIRVEDVRATVWVVQAFFYCVSAVLMFAFLRELAGGVIPSVNLLFESGLNNLVNIICDKLGL